MVTFLGVSAGGSLTGSISVSDGVGIENGQCSATINGLGTAIVYISSSTVTSDFLNCSEMSVQFSSNFDGTIIFTPQLWLLGDFDYPPSWFTGTAQVDRIWLGLPADHVVGTLSCNELTVGLHGSLDDSVAASFEPPLLIRNGELGTTTTVFTNSTAAHCEVGRLVNVENTPDGTIITSEGSNEIIRLINDGSLDIGGSTRLGEGAVLINHGTTHVRTLTNLGYAEAGSLFDNRGTLAIETSAYCGAGTFVQSDAAAITASYNGSPFLVGGTMELSGRLDMTMAPGFSPQYGTEYWIGAGTTPVTDYFDCVTPEFPVAYVDQSGVSLITMRKAEIDAIDPQSLALVYGPFSDDLVINGQLTTDPNKLGMHDVGLPQEQFDAFGRVDGLTADGASRIVLRLRTGGPGQFNVRVESEFGSLAEDRVGKLYDATILEPQNTTNPLTLNAVLADWTEPLTQKRVRQWMVFAVLRAPEDFAIYQNDPAETRPLTVTMSRVPDGICDDWQPLTKQLTLHRPPVLLLHGLWSQASTFTWPLLNNNTFVVYSHDYSPTNATPFQTNVREVREGIDRAIFKFRARYPRVAVARADVVAHSMGGILTRLFINTSPDYKTDQNYRQGNVHKLITVNTPHKGSALACQLLDPGNAGGMSFLGLAIDKLPDLLGVGCVTCGAVHDLQPHVISIGTTEIPAHAIVGVGGSEFLQQGLHMPEWLGVLEAAMRFFTIPFEIAFGNQGHDMIVDHASQVGQLSQPATQTSEMHGLAGIHFTCNSNATVGARVVELLNTEINPPGPAIDKFASQFPAVIPDSSPPLGCSSSTLQLAPTGSVGFVLPGGGISVAPGDEIMVQVQSPTGGTFVAESALIMAGTQASIVDSQPLTALLSVPSNAIGTFRVNAFARDSADSVAIADELVLPVTLNATLTSITYSPEETVLYNYSPKQQLYVTGSFSDGISRNITLTEAGTSYQSSNTAVVTVNQDGLCIARGTGSATITISNGQQSVTAPIAVQSTFSDYNGDHLIDLLDFIQFAQCFSGPGGAPDYTTPSMICRDFFDSDLDYDVDNSDFETFLALYQGPQSDCNENGILDLRDILVGTSVDANHDGIPDECATPELPVISIQETGGGTAVVEDGLPDTYTIALTREPLGDVFVLLSFDSQQLLAQPPVVQIQASTWAIPRTISVQAMADTLPEGPHFSVITHSSFSIDPDFSGIAIPTVQVNITESQINVTPRDLNCDNVVNGFDIAPFVLALTNSVGYDAAYPTCNINNADANIDGSVNELDVIAMVGCLIEGNCP